MLKNLQGAFLTPYSWRNESQFSQNRGGKLGKKRIKG